WMEAMELLEEIVATNDQMLLGPWIEAARAAATSEAEADRLEEDARALISYWGGDISLMDYANREWAGLISTYYQPRWERYFAALDAKLASGTPVPSFNWRQFGVEWSKRTGDDFATTATGDPHEVAARIAEFLDIEPVEPPGPGSHQLSDLPFLASVGGHGP